MDIALAHRAALEPELIDLPTDMRLARIRLIAELMDNAFVIPGTDRRIGLDPIIGLVPALGDAVTAMISAWIVYEAKQLGLPKWKLARMMANVGLDATLGVIPLIGDAFDCAFKANMKNLRIVIDHVEGKGGSKRA